MARPPRPRLGVSACLLGRKVRHDGAHRRDAFCADVLSDFVEWVPVCPEVEAGMPVPREPIRLVGESAAPRVLALRSGTDWTEALTAFAARRVAELEALDLSGWITKKDSPSCGMERVRVHGERGGAPRRDGVGSFVRVLRERLPLLPVEEEGRLRDPLLRESFVERIFAYARWKAALAEGMGRGELVEFHARHKLAVLAHAPAAYRRLGRIVGAAKGRPFAEVAAEYGALLLQALALPATRGRHLNVLQHAAGHFKRAATEDRRELEEVIRDYGRGHVPLVVPLTLLRSLVRRHGVAWLAAQTYLDPDPKELMLRNHA